MKKYLSVLVSLILAFSVCTVALTASAESGIITYLDEEYVYAGQFEDKVTMTVGTDTTNSAYIAKADEAGVYKITVESSNPDAIICNISFAAADTTEEPETFDDTSYDFSSEYGKDVYFVKLDEGGEAYVLAQAQIFDGESTEESLYISVEYVGNVESITYSSPVIRGLDTEFYDDEEMSISSVSCSFDVLFDNGLTATYETLGMDFSGTDAGTLDSWTASFGYLGNRYTIEIPVVDASDYIESVELPEDFNMSYVDAYPSVVTDASDETEDAEENYPEYVIINFTDGTSGQYPLNENVILPAISGTRNFCVNAMYEDGALCVTVAGYTEKFEATAQKQSFREAFPTFIANLKEIFRSSIDYYKMMKEGSTGITAGYDAFMTAAINLISSLRSEISSFISYIR